MATGTFSARYMRIWYRDRMLKTVLAFLIGTLTFSFAMLRRVDTRHVPNLGVTIAGSLVVLSLVLFILFLDRFIHRLRPVAVAGLVSRAARRVVLEVGAEITPPDAATIAQIDESEPGLIVRSARAGSIQAFDVRGLLAWARQHDARLVVQAAVGD